MNQGNVIAVFLIICNEKITTDMLIDGCYSCIVKLTEFLTVAELIVRVLHRDE